MKEVEIINSRDAQVRSQRRTDDYSTTCASQSTTESRKLALVDKEAILLLLKNCIDNLTIYRYTLDNKIRCNDIKNNKKVEKFNCDERIMKFLEDIYYVSDIFENVYNEIETQGSWNVLIKEIEKNRIRCDNEKAAVDNYSLERKRVEELRELLQEEIKSNAREIEKLKAKLVRSKNEKKRVQIKVGIESRYVTDWEKARCESSSLRFSIALERLEYTLGNLSLREKNEYRVSTEIEAFLGKNVMENKRATSQWQKRYDNEMLMYESDNRRLSSEIENRMKALEKLQFEYRERQHFIDTYVAEKKAAMERKEQEEHRRDCAIRIQAWWRGVMVRRKLGPYRPDEKKKKRSAKSKK